MFQCAIQRKSLHFIPQSNEVTWKYPYAPQVTLDCIVSIPRNNLRLIKNYKRWIDFFSYGFICRTLRSDCLASRSIAEKKTGFILFPNGLLWNEGKLSHPEFELDSQIPFSTLLAVRTHASALQKFKLQNPKVGFHSNPSSVPNDFSISILMINILGIQCSCIHDDYWIFYLYNRNKRPKPKLVFHWKMLKSSTQFDFVIRDTGWGDWKNLSLELSSKFFIRKSTFILKNKKIPEFIFLLEKNKFIIFVKLYVAVPNILDTALILYRLIF